MSSKLMDYFNKQPRQGTLSTASKDGKVNQNRVSWLSPFIPICLLLAIHS
jgi:hypothetical protein